MNQEKDKYEALLDQMTVLMDQVREAKKNWIATLTPGDLFIHSAQLFEYKGPGDGLHRFNARRIKDDKEFTNLVLCGELDMGELPTIPYNQRDHFLKIAQRITASSRAPDTDRHLEDTLSEIAPAYVLRLAHRITCLKRPPSSNIHQWADRPLAPGAETK